MKNSFISIKMISVLFLLTIAPILVNAQASALQGGVFKDTLGKGGAEIVDTSKKVNVRATIADKIGAVMKRVLEFLGIAILVVIIYGGFVWITAGGNAEKAQTALKILTNSFLGALVIGAAYAITIAVLTATGG